MLGRVSMRRYRRYFDFLKLLRGLIAEVSKTDATSLAIRA
jgi:hypothetical protein